MLIWDRERQYRTYSFSERNMLLRMSCGRRKLRWYNAIVVAINIAIPLYLYLCFGLNLYILGIAFILTDIMLNTIDQITFFTIPYIKSKSESVSVVKKCIKRLEQALTNTEKTIGELRKKYCEGCESVMYWQKQDCTRCEEMKMLYKKRQNIQKTLGQEKAYLATLTKKTPDAEEKEVKKSTHTEQMPLTSGFSVLEFWEGIRDTLNDLVNSGKFDYLIPLRKSVRNIAQNLKYNPLSHRSIPVATYAKAITVVLLFNKMLEASDDERRKNKEEAMKIAEDANKDFQSALLNMDNGIVAEGCSDIETAIQKLKELNQGGM